MESTEEKLESIEEALETLISNIQGFKVRFDGFLEKCPPDYNDKLDDISKRITQASKSDDKVMLSLSLKRLTDKIASFPKILPVKNYHHFDLRSKGFIIGGVSFFFIVAICIGLTVSLAIENHNRKQETEKYHIVKGFYPEVADFVNQRYQNDPNSITKKADSLIYERQLLLQATLEAFQTEKQHEQAVKRLKGIKKVYKRNRK